MRRPLAALLVAAALAVGPAATATAQAPGCDVASATLDWGFKESFRAYIDGSIVNGEWTVADGATYATPSFGFRAEAGRLDPRGPVGSVDFPGSVRFTGHGGVLDTTIANPVLLFRGADEDALLLLDVSGPTMDGDEVAVTATPFVTIDLSGQDFTPVDGVVTIAEAPTTLTADGEAAFPNYPDGTAFDPLSATLDVGDCDLSGLPIGGDAYGPEPGIPPALVIVPATLLAIAAAVVIALIRRRRRR
jgi:hypothetical protein